MEKKNMRPLSPERKTKIEKINEYRLAATERHPKSYVAIDEDNGEIIEHATSFSKVFSAAKKATTRGRRVAITKDVKADTLCLV